MNACISEASWLLELYKHTWTEYSLVQKDLNFHYILTIQSLCPYVLLGGEYSVCSSVIVFVSFVGLGSPRTACW
jgi:hypothetical protein